jgi:hypothetical protein
VSSAIPSFPTDANRANPLNWSAQLPVPNPTTAGSYPIAGFTQMSFYQCYASAADFNEIVAWIVFHYGNLIGGGAGHAPVAHDILATQGFGEIPAVWWNQIVTLLTASAPFNVGPKAGTCTTGAPL